MIDVGGLVVRGRRGVVVGPVDVSLGGGGAADRLAVVGPSGGGKTLLLLALAGLVPGALVAGSARVSGPVAMVFGNDALDDGRTALGNVVDAAVAAGIASPLEEASKLLTAVGLDVEAQQRPPSTLSGGQRKRAGIARALVVRPRTLLLDDPTAGLDPETARQILALTFAVVDAANACVLLATQDVDTVLPHMQGPRSGRALWMNQRDCRVVDLDALPSSFVPRAPLEVRA